MINKLNNSTLTIKRTQNIGINIAALTDSYEWAMKDSLYDRLTEDLGLDADTADYIDQTDELSRTILDLVKTEMFRRINDITRV